MGGSGSAHGRSFKAILIDRIPATHAAQPHPYRPHTSGPAGAAAGYPARPDCGRRAHRHLPDGQHSKQSTELPSEILTWR